jgi:TusA-related sulfurtransferase
MKVIENDSKVLTILNNGDVLEVTTSDKKSPKVIVECLENVLYVNKVLVKEINNKYYEEQEIKIMHELLDSDK